MYLKCLYCKIEFEIDEKEINYNPTSLNEIDDKQNGTEFTCPNCSSVMRILIKVMMVKSGDIVEDINLKETKDENQEKTLLVSIDGDFSKELISVALSKSQYKIIYASDGEEALNLTKKHKPVIVILDVGQTKITGVDLCQMLKNMEELKNIKVILLSSIYKKERYRREPDNLFGADDYIERHQIQEELLNKIESLLKRKPYVNTNETSMLQSNTKENENQSHPHLHPLPEGEEKRVPSPSRGGLGGDGIKGVFSNENDELIVPELSEKPEIKVQSIPLKEEKAKQIIPETELPKEVQDAKRFARIIISDIALYNQKSVEEGIKNNKFYEFLKDDIEEGRRLYKSRISNEISSKYDCYNEAINDFIEKMKSKMKEHPQNSPIIQGGVRR